MKKWLSIILAAGLLLYPFATFAADYGSQQTQTKQAPPVAQPLVREGDFAIKLAATLDLGTPSNEADAESLLVKAGVTPLNGWISDYPMTPEIIGQLESSIAKAASEGKLPMTSDEAKRGFFYLAAKMNLPAPAGSETANAGARPAAGPAPDTSQQVINNYYYDEGPPVITYYPPPPDYFYLYDWVPYPVVWFGFWFPGFYICNSFTRVIDVDERPAVVSNFVIDPATRRTAVIDPVERTSAGLTPRTMLRADDGRMIGTVSQFRRFAAASPVVSSRSFAGNAFRPEGFRTPEARNGAASIYNRSVARMGTARAPERPAFGGARQFNAPATEGRRFGGRTFSLPSRGMENRLNAPSAGRSYAPPVTRGYEGTFSQPRPERSFPERSFSNPSFNRPFERQFETPSWPNRSFSAPSRSIERPFIGPSGPERSFSIPEGRGVPGPMRSFPGGGWRGR